MVRSHRRNQTWLTLGVFDQRIGEHAGAQPAVIRTDEPVGDLVGDRPDELHLEARNLTAHFVESELVALIDHFENRVAHTDEALAKAAED